MPMWVNIWISFFVFMAFQKFILIMDRSETLMLSVFKTLPPKIILDCNWGIIQWYISYYCLFSFPWLLVYSFFSCWIKWFIRISSLKPLIKKQNSWLHSTFFPKRGEAASDAAIQGVSGTFLKIYIYIYPLKFWRKTLTGKSSQLFS